MKLNNILLVLLLIGVALGAFLIGQNISEKKLEEQKQALRLEIIKNDKLTKVRDGLWTKIINDTKTKADLKNQVDSLGLELENPKVIIKTEFVFKEVEKPIDGIVVKDSTLEINDAYPNKEDPFAKYFATIDLTTGTGIGRFTFNPISVNLGIAQNEDGTFRLNTAVPDFINVTSIVVDALPMELPTIDNFGWLAGAGIGKDFRDESMYLTVSGGLRYKAVSILIQGTSNQTISTGFLIEF